MQEDSDCHHKLITYPIYHPGPLNKISLQSMHSILSNVSNKQTNRQTNLYATKNITSFDKEVMINT